MISIAPLNALLEERGLTWTLFSQVSGMSPDLLSAMKKGVSITPNNLNTICRTLGCQPCDVIEYISECNYCKNDLGDFKFCPMCGRKL